MRNVAWSKVRWLTLAGVVALTGCSGIGSLTGADSGSVQLVSWHLTGCPSSASPLPGWVNCTGSVTLNVTKKVTSGYVSAYFNYPDDGAFYHGQLQVSNGAPGSITINMVNDYVSACVATYQTSVDVYDGPESSQNAKLLGSVNFTINATC